ncbi:Metallothiol transferase [Actinidia chinensis var. chinensis]|uniref:Metallothiol transferase n=1 Tax=Actinidia chinensis var. chinensis TaxID=1590841 RepID=A0A2R6Q6K1_ACTCC|nr:Metallothiol transferase [Actinidia chinensis var. chinensis]
MGEIEAAVEIEDSLRWELITPSSSSSTVNNGGSKKLPQMSLNHVSFLCKSVVRSVRFYEEVLGFVLIKRPSSFNFEGAWLFNHGIGIHLLEKGDLSSKKGRINPKDNHISFETSDMGLIMKKLDGMGIEYVTAVVEEGGVIVDQLFFHDPDGYMIEICNCQNLPVLPLSSCPIKKLPTTNITPSSYGKVRSKMMCSGEVEALMMENLAVDMMDISF